MSNKPYDIGWVLPAFTFVAGLTIAFTATHLVWAGVYERHMDKDRKAEREAIAHVAKEIGENIELSNTLEQGLAQDAKTTDAIVDRAKASLRKTPYVTVEKCQAAGYTIQPGFGPDDWYDAYRDGRNSVLYPEGVRQGSGDHTADSSSVVSASAAP